MLLSEPRLDFGNIATNPTESARPDLWPSHAWVPALGHQSDRLVDVAGGNSATNTSVSWISGGAYYSGSPSKSIADDIDAEIVGKSGFTAVCYCAPTTYASSWDVVSNSGGNNGCFRIGCNGGGTAVYGQYSSSGWALVTGSSAVTGPVVYTARYSMGSQQLWLNSSIIGSATNGTTIEREASPENVGIGVRGDLVTSYFVGTIYCVHIYSYALTYSQIADLAADPLLPLRRAPQVSYFLAAGLAIPIILNQARRRRT